LEPNHQTFVALEESKVALQKRKTDNAAALRSMELEIEQEVVKIAKTEEGAPAKVRRE
jgi:hypothetical protein